MAGVTVWRTMRPTIALDAVSAGKDWSFWIAFRTDKSENRLSISPGKANTHLRKGVGQHDAETD